MAKVYPKLIPRIGEDILYSHRSSLPGRARTKTPIILPTAFTNAQIEYAASKDIYLKGLQIDAKKVNHQEIIQ